ncbi:MAG: ArsR family transcriptional regulator [Saprospiraceae bacterium]|jgi:ArsR family transcriptional regulator
MGTTKKELFTESQNRLAALAKAIAHPARVAILQYLATSNKCVCGDIVEELPLSQSTVSQHLKELKKVGLIHGDIEGTSICYCINAKVMEEARMILGQFFTKVNCC